LREEETDKRKKTNSYPKSTHYH